MKAVGYKNIGPIDGAGALSDVEIDKPVAEGRDILVRVEAVSVNPVDTKVRQRAQPEAGAFGILGWDAVGEVVEVGAEVQDFKPGDRVWYAGAINRTGTNAEYHCVDERIVGHAPKSISAAAAAALPLTALTAYEMLFDRLEVERPVPGGDAAVMIIGGAGGVGSIAIQLLRAMTGLTIIATASRSETQDWVKALGAHHVVDHSAELAPQIAALETSAPSYVFSTNYSDRYVGQLAEFIAPQGRFGLIDDPESFDILPLKRKSVSLHWELMFTRSLFGTADISRQGVILNKVAEMVDAGEIKSTVTESLGVINAANLTRAHTLLESGKAKGKIVLEGF
ncbi:zinc-binding alcohol dehydrogenase family protein [Pacificoceanicola onchidii]|uniref:zinc-binding alcohol dehydrogenase family protein n=1 Tax=Pacificoceanicola onchidii TaxID=2562685 RepID=UPI0010A6AA38|nr:zinc-binding alcohol dehydrogenase family protein [Pacificoceanicola onchidii]